MVYLEMRAIFEDLYPYAVKIGMVSNEDIIKMIAKGLKDYNVKNAVLDPVMQGL